jgi:hypothetical protein
LNGAEKPCSLRPGRCRPSRRMLIDDFTEDEERLFVEAILDV